VAKTEHGFLGAVYSLVVAFDYSFLVGGINASFF